MVTPRGRLPYSGSRRLREIARVTGNSKAAVTPAPSEYAPDALEDAAERQRRQRLLAQQPEFAPLRSLLARLRRKHGVRRVPAFDPLDGGTNARVLLLLESPGPQSVASGFISRNNPDPTARNLLDLLRRARLPRKECILWNAVPWQLGSRSKVRAPTSKELRDARPWLLKLLAVLPRIEFIVLVGAAARSAHPWLSAHTEARILACHHPSGRVFHRWPDKSRENLQLFRWLARRLTRGSL